MMASAIRAALVSALLTAGAAQAQGQGQQTVTQIAQRLRDGYEIKAAFYDNAGGAYILLQKGTSAYMCHSSPNQTCEKLN